MSIHAPVFLAKKNRETSEEFIERTKEDIQATLDFLKKRGMWSKYHYDKWSKELEICNDEALLHAWWDDIVNGAMFEKDLEDIREMQEEYEEGLASVMVVNSK